jgi:hypothetical protein
MHNLFVDTDVVCLITGKVYEVKSARLRGDLLCLTAHDGHSDVTLILHVGDKTLVPL